VIGVSVAFKLERYLPDFFAACALVFPLVGFTVVLEKAYLPKSSPSRFVKHISLFLCSAMMSIFSWFVLSMVAFGILPLFGLPFRR
jgi:hypothetical protein